MPMHLIKGAFFLLFVSNFIASLGGACVVYPSLRLATRDSAIEGCYHHTEVYRMCFYIRSDYMYIREGGGRDIAMYLRYGKDTHYLQVLGHGVIRHNGSEFTVTRKPTSKSFLHLHLMIGRLVITRNADDVLDDDRRGSNAIPTKITRYQALLLVRMSQAIGSARGLAPSTAIQNFHLFVMGVVRSVGPSLKMEEDSFNEVKEGVFNGGQDNLFGEEGEEQLQKSDIENEGIPSKEPSSSDALSSGEDSGQYNYIPDAEWEECRSKRSSSSSKQDQQLFYNQVEATESNKAEQAILSTPTKSSKRPLPSPPLRQLRSSSMSLAEVLQATKSNKEQATTSTPTRSSTQLPTWGQLRSSIIPPVEVQQNLRRCADMRGKGKNCFGMCGTDCWCWSWVCGDCCLHRGCFQHDSCCRQGYLSVFCLCPWCFGFDCNIGYRGFPECLDDY